MSSTYKKTAYGSPHLIKLRLATSDVPTYRQIFMYRDDDFSHPEPDVIIDAGANIGLASIFFSIRFPKARIIAIEPEQSNFDLLKDNTAPYQNITPIQAALWNKNERINLVDPGLGKWGFMTKSADDEGSGKSKPCHEVQALTVDQVMRDHQLERIDILKIDIEGAEKEVFNDTSSWIDKVETLIIELNESMKPGCNRSFYLGSNGFDNEWTQGENVYLSKVCAPGMIH